MEGLAFLFQLLAQAGYVALVCLLHTASACLFLTTNDDSSLADGMSREDT
jgi:hypothetical protein